MILLVAYEAVDEFECPVIGIHTIFEKQEFMRLIRCDHELDVDIPLGP